MLILNFICEKDQELFQLRSSVGADYLIQKEYNEQTGNKSAEEIAIEDNLKSLHNFMTSIYDHSDKCDGKIVYDEPLAMH